MFWTWPKNLAFDRKEQRDSRPVLFLEACPGNYSRQAKNRPCHRHSHDQGRPSAENRPNAHWRRLPFPRSEPDRAGRIAFRCRFRITGCGYHTLFPVARPRLHAFTDYTAALRGVLLGVQLAQQKPPEQVKPLLQAALRGVYVSAGSYDLALHGIDNVEMRRVELLSEGSFTGLSPSAVRDLTFPPPYARGQAEGISSFMNTSTLQSLGVLVPRVNDVRNRPRGQAGLASRR